MQISEFADPSQEWMTSCFHSVDDVKQQSSNNCNGSSSLSMLPCGTCVTLCQSDQAMLKVQDAPIRCAPVQQQMPFPFAHQLRHRDQTLAHLHSSDRTFDKLPRAQQQQQATQQMFQSGSSSRNSFSELASSSLVFSSSSCSSQGCSGIKLAQSIDGKATFVTLPVHKLSECQQEMDIWEDCWARR